MQAWQMLSDKFVKLSEREKWLITLCGFVVIIMAVFTLMIEPVFQANQKMTKNITATKLASQQLEADVLLMTAKLKKDPDQEINLKYRSLVTESQQLSEQLSEMIESLISPSEMAALLESVLEGSKELRLVSLESQRAEPVVPNQSSPDASAYYVHPVRLELLGNYFAIVKYLESLESLPVKYYWRSFQYNVEEYPTARLVLEVYTLGTREEFIGG
ncbi:type 4a pilus biogenesis protein PilO [Vibrio japonicus]|uniref:Type 4a pilus biogenesis protein PilO n=1 Tax=Vibrio japonicus TaxID=1824638 RepID=A0ABY5LJC8_9VIBR|nr:type 4a pilus biogenesis protein PilO [Vibrio japonicus]UUM30903.1 type 4a pilus biogenesis protein PilO [Vibrio japonicus]